MNSSSDEEQQLPSVQSTRMTTEIEQLLGRANQHFIFQEFESAIEILHDVITKSPGIPDPYHVLALIYEEKKEHEKAVNFFMLAAQVTQHDSDLWAKVAHLHKELTHYKEAIYCFSRALLNSKAPDIELMKEKAVCYERLEQYRKAGKIYSKILKILPGSDSSIAKALVEVFTIMKQPKNAIKELKDVLEVKYDDNIVNLICDLEIQTNGFAECIELLESMQRQAFPLDIETKKGYCLARLGRLSEADLCFEGILKHSVIYYDDLYMLVGGLYMDLDQHESALKFFEPLLTLPRHSKPSLWFKCAVLYYEIRDLKSSEEAFLSVIESCDSPGLLVTQSKLYLSKIYKSRGDIDLSLSILKIKAIEPDEIFNINEEFIQDLISNTKLKIEESFIKDDLTELSLCLDTLIDTQLKLELRKNESIIDQIGTQALNEAISKVAAFSIATQKFQVAKGLILKALKLNMYKGSLRLDLKKLLTKLCVLDLDFEQAINAFRFVCENEESESNWIVLSTLMRKCEKVQLRSWLCKLSTKSSTHHPVCMLLGNSYFQTGNYSLAIKQYSLIYSVDDPLVNLQLGLSHLFSLCSRNIQKKEEIYIKAFKYLKTYVKFRKQKHYLEAYYNLARAYQHIQFNSKASYNYEKVLRYASRISLYGASLSTMNQKYIKMSSSNLSSIKSSPEDPSVSLDLLSQWLPT